VGLALVVPLLLAVAVSPALAQAIASPQQIDAFLLAQGSPLAGEGATFCAAGQRYGVDPAFLVAITGAESSFGQYLYSVGPQTATYNAFNWFYGPSRATSTFASWGQAITTVAQGLAGPLYYGAGRYSVAAIAPIYCPQGTQDWIANVTTYMGLLGADPADTRWQGVASTSSPAASSPDALLVIEPSVSLRPARTIIAGRHLEVGFTLANNGGVAGKWGAVTLLLRGPAGQIVTYGSAGPLVLPAGGSRAYRTSLVLGTPGVWRGWIEVAASDGSLLTETKPVFAVTVRRPTGQKAHARPHIA
jgi:hypothetical protein